MNQNRAGRSSAIPWQITTPTPLAPLPRPAPRPRQPQADPLAGLEVSEIDSDTVFDLLFGPIAAPPSR